jgi:hypothetical protein
MLSITELNWLYLMSISLDQSSSVAREISLTCRLAEDNVKKWADDD